MGQPSRKLVYRLGSAPNTLWPRVLANGAPASSVCCGMLQWIMLHATSWLFEPPESPAAVWNHIAEYDLATLAICVAECR